MKFTIDKRIRMIAELVADIDWEATYDKWLSVKGDSRIDYVTPSEFMVWCVIHADRFLTNANDSTIYTSCNCVRIEINESTDPYLSLTIETSAVIKN